MPLSYLRTQVAALPVGLRLLLSGSAWLTVAALLSQGSMLAAGVLVANALGVETYGHFTLMQATLVLLAGLAQLSFSVVVSQQVSKYRDSDPQTASRVAALCFLFTASMGFLLAAGLVAGRVFLADDLFRDASLADEILIVSAALPFVAIAAVQQGLFNGLCRFREQTLIAVVLTPVVVGAPYFGAQEYGLSGALTGLVCAFVARFCLAQIMLTFVFRQEGLVWWAELSVERIRELLTYAIPATLAGLAVSLAVWGGQAVLARQPDGATALGLFSASYMIRTIVIFLPQQTVLALLPLITRSPAGVGNAPSSRLVQRSAVAVLIFSMATAIGAAIFARPILGVYGPGFVNGYATLLILLASAPLESLTITLYQALQSQARFWRGLVWVNVPLASCVIALAVLLVPEHLSVGLALAWLVGWTLALVLTTISSRPQGSADD